MSKWVRWSAPAAISIAMHAPAHAVAYMSIAQAQQHAFPGATFSEVQAGRIWKAESGGRLVGYVVFDRVIGKHLYIDYTVAIDPSGRVRSVDILEYRESYGGEVRSPSWLGQFVGKSSASALKVGQDIRNLSGATLSSEHLTQGVKRILAAYAARGR
jgi:Na+-translocating ferredoxin:NAD+ oxidoreductase RnfG subunit